MSISFAQSFKVQFLCPIELKIPNSVYISEISYALHEHDSISIKGNNSYVDRKLILCFKTVNNLSNLVWSSFVKSVDNNKNKNKEAKKHGYQRGE